MIKIRDAGFQYHRGFSLKPVNFDINAGSFVVLIGPNGSGKSTLFSLINGMNKPSDGSITINGTEVSSLPDKTRAKLMGMVPQRSRVIFDYTVEELVAMGRFPHQRFFSGESSEDRRVVDAVMERLDLVRYRERTISSLSGGEYQRVLLARVLAQQAQILLLDEPGNHLDLKHQTMLLNLLREEVENGKTVVAVLHDINQALHYADSGLLLDRGVCIRSGSPSEFLTRELIREVFDVEMREYRSSDGEVVFGLEGRASGD